MLKFMTKMEKEETIRSIVPSDLLRELRRREKDQRNKYGSKYAQQHDDLPSSSMMTPTEMEEQDDEDEEDRDDDEDTSQSYSFMMGN